MRSLHCIIAMALVSGGLAATGDLLECFGQAGGKTSPEATAYLEHVLGLMQTNSIRRDKIDWKSLRAKTWTKAAGAQTPADTHAAIVQALAALGDNHSLLIAPNGTVVGPLPRVVPRKKAPTEPEGRIIDGRWAYVLIPGCNALEKGSENFASNLLGIVKKLDAKAPDGWIVDLRYNSGGSMWPMLAGIGPVVGEGILGAMVYPGGVLSKWFHQAGKVGAANQVVQEVEPYRLRRPNPYVAVLTDEPTASSGEATTIAFRGRPRTRSFGQPTFGVSTSNQHFKLSDGAILLVTVAKFADRTGKVYGEAVIPDEVVKNDGDDDAVLNAAAAWLGKQVKVSTGK